MANSEKEIAELAIKFSNKYSKSSMALALSVMMIHGGRISTNKILKQSLEATKDLKKDELEALAGK